MTETPLEFPDGELITGVEVAFGADLAADPSQWDYVDLSDRLMDQSVNITRGRQDESSDVTPTTAALILDNPDGYLTPDDAVSPYWPYVDLGNPARCWVELGDTRLVIPPADGSRAVAAHTTQFNISDLDIRVDFRPLSMPPLEVRSLLVERDTVWRIYINADRSLTLEWSVAAPYDHTATSLPGLVPHRSRIVTRVFLETSSGGTHFIQWFTGDEVGGTFTQVGPTDTRAGTANIGFVTGDIIIGQPDDLDTNQALHAEVYAYQQRTSAGAIRADAHFEGLPDGTSAFTDDVGRSWVIGTPATIDNRHYRITGTTDKWSPTWPYGDLSEHDDGRNPGGIGEGEARSSVTIAGLLRRLQHPDTQGSPIQLSTSALLRTPLYEGSLDSVLAGYWPLEDAVGSSNISAVVGAPVPVGAAQLASAPGPAGSLPGLTLTNGAALSFPVSPVGSAWQVDVYMLVESAPAVLVFASIPNANLYSLLFTVDATNLTAITRDPVGATLTTTSTSAASFFGVWQHVKMWMTAAGAWEVNWTPVVDGGATGTLSGTGANVGAVRAPAVGAVTAGDTVALLHMAILNGTDITSADGAGLGWPGEMAADRIARLAAEEGVSLRLVGDASDTELMGPQETGTRIAAMRSGELADGGVMMERRDALGLIYRTRSSFYNQPVNLAIDALPDVADMLPSELAPPLSPTRDDQKAVNQFTANRSGGGFAVAREDALVKRWGLYPNDVTVNVASDSQLPDIASWELHRGIQPRMRYPGVSAEVSNWVDPAEWLLADMGDRTSVSHLPPQHPGDADILIEGYTETLSPQSISMTLNCSPAGVWDVAQVDDINGEFVFRADTAGSRAAEGIDTTADELLVTTTAGPLWRPSPSNTPFDIGIAGERVTVTDIDAETGSELFTTESGVGFRDITTPASAQIAFGVTAPTADCLLLAVWRSTVGTYTAPGSMAEQSETNGSASTMMDATQTLVSAGSTLNRTATFSASAAYQSGMVAITSNHAGVVPTVEEHLSGFIEGASSGDLVLTLDAATEAGWWILAFGARNVPGAAPRSVNLGTFVPLFAKTPDQAGPELGCYVMMVTKPGADRIVFQGDPTDASLYRHGRVYVLSGITDQSQLFTVVRSVNGVVKGHPAGTPVQLWEPYVLGR